MHYQSYSLGNDQLKEAIRRLPVPIVWQRLGLRTVKNCCVVRSPLHDDRHPSFSIFAGGTRWKDHSTGEGGDSYTFYKLYTGKSGEDAYRAFLDLAAL